MNKVYVVCFDDYIHQITKKHIHCIFGNQNDAENYINTLNMDRKFILSKYTEIEKLKSLEHITNEQYEYLEDITSDYYNTTDYSDYYIDVMDVI